MSDTKRFEYRPINTYEAPLARNDLVQSQTGVRILNSDVKVETKEERLPSQRIVRQQQQYLNGQTFSIGNQPLPNPCQAPPLCMNVVVVSKEEIEAPWRLECEYLQSIIAELEQRKETKVVEKVVEKEKIVQVVDNSRISELESALSNLRNAKDDELRQLQNQLYRLQNENGNLQSQLQNANGDQTKLNQLEAEFRIQRSRLEDELRKAKGENDALQLQFRILQGENEQLKQRINSRDLEIQQLNQKILSLQSSLSDNSRVSTLEIQIAKLQDQIQSLNQQNYEQQQRIQELQGLNQELKISIRQYEQTQLSNSQEIDRLRGLLNQREDELYNLRSQYDVLKEQKETVITEKVSYLSSEVEVWKQKFIQSNHLYNECKEELTMAQAELESLKNQKREVVQSTRVTTSTRSQLGTTGTTTTGGARSEYVKKSGIQSQFQQ